MRRHPPFLLFSDCLCLHFSMSASYSSAFVLLIRSSVILRRSLSPPTLASTAKTGSRRRHLSRLRSLIAFQPLKNLSGQLCQICGDTVGQTASGDIFVACNECSFPVCKPCYEYERKDGNQCCPQCKTRYKRQKGSARVDGDDDEEDVDDLENEFDTQGNKQSEATVARG